MIRILITGAAGNIGSALTEKLVAKKDFFVVAVDNLSTGSKAKLPYQKNQNNFVFVKLDTNDFTELSSVFLNYGFDYVFHFAATVGVKRTIENPILVLNDIDGIRNVLNLSKNTGVRRVFYSSSSEVYGEPVFLPQNEETTPLNSRLPYAIVKNLGEAYFRSYEREFGLDYTIFRFFNTYGPNQSEDFVVSRFLSLACQGKDITLYGDGTQTRTFCYIDDNVDTMLKILTTGCCLNDTLNIGSDIETSIKDLAQIIITQSKSTSKVVHLPPLAEGDMTRRQPDITKMKSILARDLIPIQKGIDKLLDKRR